MYKSFRMSNRYIMNEWISSFKQSMSWLFQRFYTQIFWGGKKSLWYFFFLFFLQNERVSFVFIRRIKSWVDEGSALGPDRHARDIKSLDQYAMERWEVILHFMVGSSCAVVSQDLAQLLIQAGLMKRYTGAALPHSSVHCFQLLNTDVIMFTWKDVQVISYCRAGSVQQWLFSR